MTELFCEASLCRTTGAAGWGCVVVDRGEITSKLQGPLLSEEEHGATLAELHAVQEGLTSAALRGFICRGAIVIISVRSTACAGVLRWAFPKAPYEGPQARQTKKVRGSIKSFAPLAALKAEVDRHSLHVAIRLVSGNERSSIASDLARAQMLLLRP